MEATLTGAFLCAGQSCTAAEQILVAREVREAYVEKLRAATKATIHLGDPFADGTTMGPLNNEPVAAKMDAHVADAVGRGATVVTECDTTLVRPFESVTVNFTVYVPAAV